MRSLSFARIVLLLALLLGAVPVVSGQPPLPPPSFVRPPLPPANRGVTIRESQVGYIDNAIPGDIVRFRYESAYDFARPNRAEFFYAQSGLNQPGLPFPESSIDYQDVSLYLEHQWVPRVSSFLEVPVRFLNPELNANAEGLADLNVGAKAAWWLSEEFVGSFQFRVYTPTGAGGRGLSTEHVSLEPAMLFWSQLTERCQLEGEFRTWVPVGGTDFAGTVLRYGLGVSYQLMPCPDRFRLAPVVEAVGWTVLDGKESMFIAPGLVAVQNSAGRSILNFKAGLRCGFSSCMDIYAGYGQSLTGDRWYEDVFRIETRWLY